MLVGFGFLHTPFSMSPIHCSSSPWSAGPKSIFAGSWPTLLRRRIRGSPSKKRSSTLSLSSSAPGAASSGLSIRAPSPSFGLVRGSVSSMCCGPSFASMDSALRHCPSFRLAIPTLPRSVGASCCCAIFVSFEYNRRAAVEVDGRLVASGRWSCGLMSLLFKSSVLPSRFKSPRVLTLKRGALNLTLVLTPFCKKLPFAQLLPCLYGQPGAFRAWTTYMGSVSPGWGEMSIDSGGAKPGV